MSSEILYLSFHRYNQSNHTFEFMSLESNSKLSGYINKLLNVILKNSSTKSFEFERNTTEVVSLIKDINNNILNGIADNCKSLSEKIADRLLDKEKESEEEQLKRNLSPLQKGSLLIFFLKENENKRVIISKVDYETIIDLSDLKEKEGLSEKNIIYKAFLCDLIEGDELEFDNIYIYDNNAKPPKYWWKEFLELRELTNDEESTKNSLLVIDHEIFYSSELKSFKYDNMILRNSVIGYYRSHDRYDHDELYNEVFKNYQPYSSGYPINKVREQFKNLKYSKKAKKKQFDTSFNIIKNAMGKRIVNIVPLNTNIELRINGAIENIEQYIEEYFDETNDTKYVKIKVDDELYNGLKRK